MTGRTRGVLVGVVVAAALAAGCGGATGVAGRPAAGLSHAQLVGQADALCRSYNHVTSQEFRGVSSNAQAARVWGTMLGQVDRLNAQLSRLRPAAADAGAYRVWLDLLVDSRPLMAAARPPQAQGTLGAMVLAAAKQDELAARLGMHDCAIDVDPTEHPITKQRYIQVADGVCSSAFAGAYVAAHSVPKARSVQGFGRVLAARLPVSSLLVRDLHAIPVPPGDEAQIANWLNARDLAYADAVRAQHAAYAGNAKAFKLWAASLLDETNTAATLATNYGATACAATMAF
jgi:hypothetical protein